MTESEPQPYYLPEDTDISGLLRMDCPECGVEARVQGNAIHLWLVAHQTKNNERCPSSHRKLLPAWMRKAEEDRSKRIGKYR